MDYFKGLAAVVGVMLVITAPLAIVLFIMAVISFTIGFEFVGPIVLTALFVGLIWHVVRVLVLRKSPRQ